MSLKLGEMLLANKVISQVQLDRALETQKQIGGKLGVILVKLRYVTEDQLAAFLGEQLKIPVLGLKDLIVQPNVSALVDVEVLEKHQMLPLQRHGDALLVAAVDAMDLDSVDAMSFLTGLKIELASVSRINFLKAIDYYFHNKPCPELAEAEKAKGTSKGQKTGEAGGTRVPPQVLLQALTELLIEKKIINRDDLLAKVAGKNRS